MRRDVREVRPRKDYTLRTDHRLFQNVAIWDLQHHLNHYMVLGCLRGDPAKDLTDYLCKARRFPLWPIRCDLAFASDKVFSELKTQILKPPL